MPFFTSLDARHIVGESNYGGHPGPSSLKHRNHDELDGRFFWWINRFVVGTTTFDIGYGDREFLIETKLFYQGIADQFTPWELLSAAQVSDPDAVSGASWVHTPDFIVSAIEKIGRDVQTHWNILGNPGQEIIDRARVCRSQRMFLAQEEQRNRHRDQACVLASTAFHAGRYAEAKHLLEPFRNDDKLVLSSAKILEIAEKKLSNSMIQH